MAVSDYEKNHVKRPIFITPFLINAFFQHGNRRAVLMGRMGQLRDNGISQAPRLAEQIKHANSLVIAGLLVSQLGG